MVSSRTAWLYKTRKTHRKKEKKSYDRDYRDRKRKAKNLHWLVDNSVDKEK